MDRISQQQLTVMVARIVEFQEKFSSMSKVDAHFVIQDTSSAIELFLKAIANRHVIFGLFKELSSVEIPATTEIFNVEKYFWLNPERPVKIGDCNIKFFDWFYGKTEAIKASCLLERSLLLIPFLSSDPIITSLGGEEKVETFMVDIAFLLGQQANGEPGALDINGNANIFFVRNSAQQMKEVDVYWDGKRWLFQAYSLDSGHERKDASIIFHY